MQRRAELAWGWGFFVRLWIFEGEMEEKKSKRD